MSVKGPKEISVTTVQKLEHPNNYPSRFNKKKKRERDPDLVSRFVKIGVHYSLLDLQTLICSKMIYSVVILDTILFKC